MMNQYLPDSGSKVNGLEQPFHPWRVYCHLLHIPSEMGGDQGEGWNGGVVSLFPH
ncbi:uncharacterized protein METZ01_LOCUS230394 [marine metagenome]|uniref:Uncharacterized protein n=1 Tax=marine metagenome TaxID=408172 RepID=A0A382GQY1_9ZZZZ